MLFLLRLPCINMEMKMKMVHLDCTHETKIIHLICPPFDFNVIITDSLNNIPANIRRSYREQLHKRALPLTTHACTAQPARRVQPCYILQYSGGATSTQHPPCATSCFSETFLVGAAPGVGTAAPPGSSFTDWSIGMWVGTYTRLDLKKKSYGLHELRGNQTF